MYQISRVSTWSEYWYTKREKNRDTERHRQLVRDRATETDREIDRDRHTQTDRQTVTDRQRQQIFGLFFALFVQKTTIQNFENKTLSASILCPAVSISDTINLSHQPSSCTKKKRKAEDKVM